MAAMRKTLEVLGMRHADDRRGVLDPETPVRAKVIWFACLIVVVVVMVALNKAGYWI